MRFAVLLALVTVPALAAPPPAGKADRVWADWPTFLGPAGNGSSPETGILTKWPPAKEGLKVVWEVPMGLGYAPPVVSRGRLFHFDRFGNDARLSCCNAQTGKLIWKFEYPTDYEDLYGYSPGPRACPVVDGDRVYIYGPDGMLHCLAYEDGKEKWKVDTAKEYPFHQNFFGVGSVPIVDGELLIVAIGGSPKGPRPNDLRKAEPNGSCLVAFNKVTGKEVYKSGNELASYASPMITTLGGRRMGLYFARGSLIGFEPKTGKIEFQYPWRAKILESVNAANPVVVGDRILLTECYGPGAVLLKASTNKCEPVWSDLERDREDKSLRCHWNTPIHVDGYVYGSSGRHENEAELRCVELATGNVKWAVKNLSRSSLTLIDGHFLCLTETGVLHLMKVNPEKAETVGTWQTDLDAPSWAAPVVAQGLVYLRGRDRLICAELIPGRPK